MFLLSRALTFIVRTGTLHVIDAGGARHAFGNGQAPAVTIRFHDRWTPTRIALNPSLGVGEAYMDGRMTIEEGGDIFAFLDLVVGNMRWERGSPFHVQRFPRLKQLISWLHQINPAERSQRNVAHHYDLSGKLYDLFLDKDRQYSCAYFPTGGEDLETAQLLKKAHIAAKLLLKPGQRVLDIGSGWGGLGLYLNRVAGVSVTGVTLSEEQHALSNERARAAGVADRVKFRMQDYRGLTEKFDRVVSVGMFEHVGAPHYDRFFGKLHDVLAEDGVALLHTIGRADGPGRTDPWTRKYIFPGGYVPSLSEIAPAIERAGLYITDLEVLRLHYARTLRHWYDRTRANRDQIIALYDERFLRMWEFYLAGAWTAFAHSGHVVFQFQLAKRQDAAPLSRDYMAEAERRYLALEKAPHAEVAE